MKKNRGTDNGERVPVLDSHGRRLNPEVKRNKASQYIKAVYDRLYNRYAPLWYETLSKSEKIQVWILVATLAYAGFAGWTLISIRRQAKIAEQAATDVRRQFNMGERSYLSIGRADGNAAEFAEPLDTSQKASMILYLTNSGRLPAMGVSLSTFTMRIPPDLISSVTKAGAGHIRYQQGEGAPPPEFTSGITVPGNSVHAYWIDEIMPDSDVITVRTTGASVVVNGILEWCDPLGHYGCDQFTMYWKRRPVERFIVTMEFDCTWIYTPMPPPEKRGLKVLPPCPQPEEYEQREKDLVSRLNVFAMTPTTEPQYPTPLPSPTS